MRGVRPYNPRLHGIRMYNNERGGWVGASVAAEVADGSAMPVDPGGVDFVWGA